MSCTRRWLVRRHAWTLLGQQWAPQVLTGAALTVWFWRCECGAHRRTQQYGYWPQEMTR